MMRSIVTLGFLAVALVYHAATVEAADKSKAPEKKPAPAQKTDRQFVRDLTLRVQGKYNVPAAAILVSRGSEIVALSASGVRKQGDPIPVTPDDMWHIGSNTKAVTATVIGRLVEEGKLRFDMTAAEAFPDMASEFHPDFRSATLQQFLCNTSGVAANPGMIDFLSYRSNRGNVVEQRRELTKEALSGKPEHEPGSAYLYSNQGYVIAGAMAEAAAGERWEQLVRTHVFEPLGIVRYGFGAPGSGDELDQPRGHRKTMLGGRKPAPVGYAGDNPEVYGPAGTLHLSLEGWNRFAREHMAGWRGQGTLLSPETYRLLHTPPDNGKGYAAGWLVRQDEAAGQTFLTHAGSNTMWYALIRLYPEQDTAFLIAANDGSQKTRRGVLYAVQSLTERFIVPGTPAVTVPEDMAEDMAQDGSDSARP